MAWEGWQVLLLTVGIIAGLIACCVGLTILYERYLRHEMATREVQFVPADGEPPSEPFNGGLPAGTTNRKPGMAAAWAEKMKNKMGASAGSIELAAADTEPATTASRRPSFLSRRSSTPVYNDSTCLDPKLEIAYFTDVEGNWEYFLGCVEKSPALTLVGLEEGGSRARIDLADGWRLVFGGDVCDKGSAVGGSIRVTRSLLLLKQRYAERVSLLLGNRDLNKCRLTSELHRAELHPSLLPHLPGPWWVPQGPRCVTPIMYLRKRVAKANGIEDPMAVSDELLHAANTLPNRLRYILAETMGADGELERRAAELEHIRNSGGDITHLVQTAASVSDVKAHDLGVYYGNEEQRIIDAVDSFLSSVAPGGFMFEYVHAGVLGCVVGDTLFVHGGLISQGNNTSLMSRTTGERRSASLLSSSSCDDCYGYVPGPRVPIAHGGENVEELRTWLRKLHSWKTSQLTDWQKSPRWEEPEEVTVEDGGRVAADDDGGGVSPKLSAEAVKARTRGGEALQHYALPNAGPSVVMSRHLDAGGMPLDSPDYLMSKLNQCGVYRVIVGHTPHGNCPTVVNSGSGGGGGGGGGGPRLQVIMVDTSYSDVKSSDMRGRAVGSVSILHPSPSNVESGQRGKSSRRASSLKGGGNGGGGCTSVVSISGVLQDGSSYEYTLHGPSAAASADPHNDESSSSDDLIGLREVLPLPPASDSIRSEDGKPLPQRFVKARLSSGDYLMCAVTDGFKYAYSTLSEAEVRKAVGLSSTSHANGSSSVAAEDELPPSPAPSPPPVRTSSPSRRSTASHRSVTIEMSSPLSGAHHPERSLTRSGSSAYGLLMGGDRKNNKVSPRSEDPSHAAAV